MDSGSALIGIIIVVVCIIPFMVMTRNRKKRGKQKLQILINAANEQNCKLDQHEIGSDYVIGIDKEKSFVFFYKKTNIVETIQYVDLNTIKECKINYPSLKSDKNEYIDQIDRLLLSFIPLDKNTKPIDFEFYNMKFSIQLSGELESIKKWSKIIDSQLK